MSLLYYKGLLEKCRILQEYSTFIDLVRQKTKAGMGLEQAVKETIAYCMENDILKDYLNEHSMEVYDMIDFEWNMDDAKKIWREEAAEEATEQKAIDVAEKCLQENMDYVLISRITSLPVEEVARLAKVNNS